MVVALGAGIGLCAYWWHGDLARDDAKGIFMLGVVALGAGAKMLLGLAGIDIFSRGSAGLSTDTFDSDSSGCGDGGGD